MCYLGFGCRRHFRHSPRRSTVHANSGGSPRILEGTPRNGTAGLARTKSLRKVRHFPHRKCRTLVILEDNSHERQPAPPRIASRDCDLFRRPRFVAVSLGRFSSTKFAPFSFAFSSCRKGWLRGRPGLPSVPSGQNRFVSCDGSSSYFTAAGCKFNRGELHEGQGRYDHAQPRTHFQDGGARWSFLSDCRSTKARSHLQAHGAV